MRISLMLAAGVLICAGGAIGAQGRRHKTLPSKALVYRDIKPILQICAACHKPPKAAHGLDLTTYAAIMRGDKKGKVVSRGNPNRSRLATVLQGKPQPMPPGGELDRQQITRLERWIRDGAREK